MRDAIAWLCVMGDEKVSWIYLALDRVEWTSPRYGHQN